MKQLNLVVLLCVIGTVGCKHPTAPDLPQLTPQVRLTDANFHSAILSREMHLRIVVPATLPQGASLPVIYLLHGAGADYRDWTNHSRIAFFAAQNYVLVMPDEAGAYYINEASGRHRRYEDYFIDEVVPEVHHLVPYASNQRADNAVIGISRGGYGAVVIGLKHPGLFSFVGDLSGAVDFPERHFRWHAPLASLGNRRVFGAVGSPENQGNDPFVLLRKIPVNRAPYFFITCGDKDPLFEPNHRFALALARHHIPSEFHVLHGGHNWSTWTADIPLIESALLKKIPPVKGAIGQ
jgi:putative tributyrin esterase